MSNEQNTNVSVEILKRLKSLDSLPRFPETLMKLDREIANNATISVKEVADLVAQDARLVAGLIKLANSAKYGVGKEINDLQEAIARIGLKELSHLAHAIHYQSSITRKPPFSDAHYLKHSLASALLAQALAKHFDQDSGAAFLAALMRDIGIYLLAIDDREKYLKVIELTQYDIERLPQAENQIFGTYHPLMSARLLQDWRFPNSVVMGVAFHHKPENAPKEYQASAYLTYLAEFGVFRMGLDNGVADISDENRETVSEALMLALGYFDLSLEKFDEIISSVSEDMAALNL